MRALLQRVSQARVFIDGANVADVGKGWAILLGIGSKDDEHIANSLVEKIISLRGFEDSQGKMNLDAHQAGAEFLIISQVTLYADLSRGRRPSLAGAAPQPVAEPLIDYFVDRLQSKGFSVATGHFGAFMDVEIHNTGPVTFFLSTEGDKQ